MSSTFGNRSQSSLDPCAISATPPTGQAPFTSFRPSVSSNGEQLDCPSSISDAHSIYRRSSPVSSVCVILGCVQSMEYLDTFLTYYGTALVCIAVAWLGWRSSQVLFKPIDELASLLGIEVPVAPTLALAGLKADGFLLQWSPVEQKGVTVSYYMTVNGVNVGELSPLDPSLQVSGLLPKHGYVVRIAAKLNNFVDTSLPLSIQTKPASSDDFFDVAESQPHVAVRPYRTLIDTATTSSHSVPMQREHSGSISNQQKRNVSARRQTQSSITTTNVATESFKEEATGGEDTMAELTEKLDRLRAETEQCDSLITSEEAKFHDDQESLTKSLHEIQQLLHDRSNATRKLNQHVAALVTEESSARKHKAVLDKQLDKVLQERHKMNDDMARWISDASDIDRKIERFSEEQSEYEVEAEKIIALLKADFVDEKAKNDALEESIRLTIASIREYEDKSKVLADEETDDANGITSTISEEEESWKTRLAEVQQRCAALASQQHPLHEALLKDQLTLEWWRQYHFSQTQSYQVPQIEVAPQRRSSGHPTDRLAASGFDHNNNTNYGISPNFINATPFLNITNGMTIPNESMAMSPTEPDSAFSAVPTSPSVLHTFLPSGLFGDDGEPRFGTIGQRTTLNRDDSGNQIVLPGLGAPGTLDEFPQGSPVSQQSQSPIVFASPGASNSNLSFNPASTSFADADRRSIRSGTGSSRAVSGGASGTKFAGFFHLGRQRNKAGSDEGPILGSLRASESQSTPRSENVASVQSAAPGFSRRRGSHSGPSWMGQMLARTTDDSQKKRFNVFGGAKKAETWSEGKEMESHGLPRPSAETSSRFHWPNSTEEPVQTQGPKSANATWRYSNSGNWPTQYHSRNSSKHVFSHANDDAPESTRPLDEHVLPPIGAPITTRPHTPTASISRPQTSTPLRLNPNAPTFTGGTFGPLSNGDNEDDTATSQRKERRNGQETSKRESYDGPSEDGRSSPFSSRKSRDGLSMLSVDGASESANRESFENSISSAAPSESGNPPKESFMRKLTRKGSAGFSSLAGRRGAGSKKHSIAALAAAEATDESQASDEDNIRSTLTLSDDNVKERSAMSPLLGAGGSIRGFSLKNLRRRKGERTPAESVDGDEDDKA